MGPVVVGTVRQVLPAGHGSDAPHHRTQLPFLGSFTARHVKWSPHVTGAFGVAAHRSPAWPAPDGTQECVMPSAVAHVSLAGQS